MNGEHLDLNDNMFEMAGSQFGVMLFSHFERGLRELVRVTQPGGTVFLVVFGPIQKVEFLGLFIKAVQEVKPGLSRLSAANPPLPFQVSDEGVLLRKMEQAGLINVLVNPVVHELSFHTGKAMWNWVTSSNPIMTRMISGLSDEQIKSVVKILEQRIREHCGRQEAAIIKVVVNIAVGVKAK